MGNFEFIYIYLVVTAIFAISDIVIGLGILRDNGKEGRTLSLACIFAAIVVLAHFGSAMSKNYMAHSVYTSIYLYGLDLVLITVLCFSLSFVGFSKHRPLRIIKDLFIIYCVFEGIIFALNPVFENVVSFEVSNSGVVEYSMVMKPLFVAHLVFCYLSVIMITLVMLIKMLSVPVEYKKQYVGCIVSLIVIVGFNAVFLYVDFPGVFSELDMAVFVDTIGLIMLYWSSFGYSTYKMPSILKSEVVSYISQGIVMFDYNRRLAISNDKADELLVDGSIVHGMSEEEFLAENSISLKEGEGEKNGKIQIYINKNNNVTPVICNYNILRNSYDQAIGKLFVFTDAASSVDVLTGFSMWQHFRREHDATLKDEAKTAVLAVIDISGLVEINRNKGRDAGDMVIQDLANNMRKCFGDGTYFARGLDATVIALCPDRTESYVFEKLEEIDENFPEELQFSLYGFDTEEKTILEALDEAMTGLNIRRLMDENSSHSPIIKSLMQALEECDSDTNDHVKRTQYLGIMLGRKMGLPFVELCKLGLLCMLHDIGKIGVPLEILNKPGKLSDKEWEIIKSHVDKGYQITKSSEELVVISEMVWAHHERWDGKGYPNGIAGEQIPVLSRIISVVDAYDAMVNSRSYRNALSEEKAKSELVNNAGTQFDPGIVTDFIELIEDPEFKMVRDDEIKYRKRPFSGDNVSLSKERINVHDVTFSRYLVDRDLYIVSGDENFESFTGYTVEEAVDMHLNQLDLIPAGDKKEYMDVVNARLSTIPEIYVTHRILRKDGQIIEVFCYGKMYFDSATREFRSEIIVTRK